MAALELVGAGGARGPGGRRRWRCWGSGPHGGAGDAGSRNRGVGRRRRWRSGPAEARGVVAFACGGTEDGRALPALFGTENRRWSENEKNRMGGGFGKIYSALTSMRGGAILLNV
jgi:hypothetical protein